MSFLRPEWLYLILAALIALALGAFHLLRKQRILKSFSLMAPTLCNRKPGPYPWIQLLLFAAAVVSMAMAMAGPLGGDRVRLAYRKGMDICFVVDVSRSMLAVEESQTRLAQAKKEIGGLLEAGAQDRFGLICFSGSAKRVCPLTWDHESFLGFLKDLNVYSADQGGSSLASGLLLAKAAFLDSERPKAIVLVSDGEDLEDQKKAVDAASEARQAGIRVYCLMIGDPRGAKIPGPDGQGFLLDQGEEVISRPDPNLMERLARAGGGGFTAAHDTAFPLDHLYGEVMDFEELFKTKTPETRHQIFLWIALVFLTLELLPSLFQKPVILLLLLAPLFVSFGEKPVQMAKKGNELFQSGNYAGALNWYKKVLPQMENNGILQHNLGLCYLKLNLPDKATLHFKKALIFESSKQAACFGLGAAAYESAKIKLNSGEGLTQALGESKAAEQAFLRSIKENCWVNEAQSNLALTRRLIQELLKKIKDEGAAPIEGQGETKDTNEGQGEKNSEEKGRNGSKAEDKDILLKKNHLPMGEEEKERIFALLKDLEKKRAAMEQERLKENRAKSGVKDW